MANVNANLTRNYKMRDPFKGYAFHRKSDYFKPILIDVEIENRPVYKARTTK
jgi:hypothetical protein